MNANAGKLVFVFLMIGAGVAGLNTSQGVRGAISLMVLVGLVGVALRGRSVRQNRSPGKRGAKKARRPELPAARSYVASAAPPTKFVASDPGGLHVSRARLEALRAWRCTRDEGFTREELDRIETRLQNGDGSAAVVTSLEPFRVAVYAADVDAVAILEYPPEARGDRRVGDRMVGVSQFCRCFPKETEPDLALGPKHLGRWTNFSPIVAELFADDPARIELLKSDVSAQQWARCEELAARHPSREERAAPVRCGFFPCSHGPVPQRHFTWREGAAEA